MGCRHRIVWGLSLLGSTGAFACTQAAETQPWTYGGEDVPILCRDGEDNDGDGLVDCDDPDCRPLYTCVNEDSESGNDSTDDTEVVTDWLYLTTGDFEMGRNDGDPSEAPRHVVYVTHFYIMHTEATESQYQACVDAGACEPIDITSYCASDAYRSLLAEEPGEYPMNCLSWVQANDFCAWVGGRLLSEAEWEYAASGWIDRSVNPWGDEEASCDLAVIDDGVEDGPGCGLGRPRPVCSKEDGSAVVGACDMIGNLQEWVEDDVHRDYTDAPAKKAPWVEDPRTEGRMVRGGAYFDGPDITTYSRRWCDPADGCNIEDEMDGYGVRCAK